jgi:hypothetical protein
MKSATFATHPIIVALITGCDRRAPPDETGATPDNGAKERSSCRCSRRSIASPTRLRRGID